jgi:hypothetical protein
MPRTNWKLDGKPVLLGEYADLLPYFRPGGAHAPRVQEALNYAPQNFGDWEPGKNLTTCTELGTIELPSLTVKLIDPQRAQIIWGVHATHRARRPQASPFVQLQTLPKSPLLTIELAGTPEKPILVI